MSNIESSSREALMESTELKSLLESLVRKLEGVASSGKDECSPPICSILDSNIATIENLKKSLRCCESLCGLLFGDGPQGASPTSLSSPITPLRYGNGR